MIREDILDCAATIIDLRAEVEQLKEKVDRFAAFSRRDLACAEKAIRERDIALRAISAGRFDD